MLLSRGVILLFAGASLIITGFTLSLYYVMNFLTGIQDENQLIEAGKSISVSALIETEGSQQGAFAVSFSENFGPLTVRVIDPLNNTVVEKEATPPLTFEVFDVPVKGDYVLTVSNLSNEIVEASASIAQSSSLTSISAPVVIAGIPVIIAGATLSIIDRRKRHQMKQFGDNSDLV